MSVSRARRRNKRGAKSGARGHVDENRFEQETRTFFARVHEGYLAIAAREPQRVVVIDARGTPDQTHRSILAIVNQRLRPGKN
jgi:dTMP kinase